jgi:hypothetical protein
VDELLQQVSEQTGIPVDMLERAAQARAGAGGTTAEAVVAGWAGAPVPAAGEPAAPAPAAPAAAPAPAAAEEAPASLEVEVLAAAEPAAEEPEPEPELVAAGPGIPGWLSAAFVLIPFIAVLYALYIPNGPDCGSAGRLDIDPVSGNAVNCDGSEYGFVSPDFFAIGEGVYETSFCTACHGPTGGGGSGPALAGGSVVETFPSCSDHIAWVTLGSAGWQNERGSTYGDTAKTVSGGMPGFGSGATALADEELRSVVLYERVAFGGEDLAAAQSACFGPGTEVVAAP